MTDHPKPDFVYRGVSKEMYDRTNGRLVPKAPGPRETTFLRDGSVRRTRGADPQDLGAVRDTSVINTILRHQLHQAGYPTPGISTSPHFANAKTYALYSAASGVVYKIDVSKFQEHGVSAFAIADFVPVPSVPDDEEILLFAKDNGALPSEIVVDLIKVTKP